MCVFFQIALTQKIVNRASSLLKLWMWSTVGHTGHIQAYARTSVGLHAVLHTLICTLRRLFTALKVRGTRMTCTAPFHRVCSGDNNSYKTDQMTISQIFSFHLRACLKCQVRNDMIQKTSTTTYYSKGLSAWFGFTDTVLLWIQSLLFLR